jgi:hypothetical protein
MDRAPRRTATLTATTHPQAGNMAGRVTDTVARLIHQRGIMLRPTKTLMASLTVVVALLACVTTTSANNISQSSRTFRGTWAPLRIIDRELFGTEGTVSCNVTLEGSFHSSSIRKVARAQVGYISRAVMGSPCTGGTASILSGTLPWHLTYDSFTGTLPNITKVQFGLSDAGLSVDPAGEILPQCLGQADPTTLFLVGFYVGFLVGIWVYAGWATYRANNLRVSCGTGGMELFGEGPVTVLGSTAEITVRLI